MDIARGFLNFALGWFLKDEEPVTAAVAFTKAVQTALIELTPQPTIAWASQV